MATYLGITESSTDPDAPLTAELGKAWTNNLLAVVEGSAGAPRIKVATEYRNSGSTTTYAIPDGYRGFRIDFGMNYSGSGTDVVFISLSTDGTTFSTGSTIASTSSTDLHGGVAYIDTESGVFKSIYNTQDGALGSTGTLAGASDAVTHVRIEVGNDAAYIMTWNGGEA